MTHCSGTPQKKIIGYKHDYDLIPAFICAKLNSVTNVNYLRLKEKEKKENLL
jgi:hypothetical protein